MEAYTTKYIALAKFQRMTIYSVHISGPSEMVMGHLSMVVSTADLIKYSAL